MNDDAVAQPWYREPWPWLLMAGPAAVVVAGVITVVLAVKSDDGLVADDYYKQGLAINRTLARAHQAAHDGISGQAELIANGTRLRVALQSGQPLSGAVMLRMIHPTRAGLDRTVILRRVGPVGNYEGSLGKVPAGEWNIILEADKWRLDGVWNYPASSTFSVGPAKSP